MSQVQRPWWLLVNRPAGLVTTIQEQATPTERVWTVESQPVVQGLAWLTCGPLSALGVITLITGAAIALNVQAMPAMTKVIFILAFLGLPALAWGLTIIIANKLSAPHLEAMRQGETREGVIRWDRNRGQLFYRTTDLAQEQRLDFTQIQRVAVLPAVGARDVTQVCLYLETDLGPVLVLNESLGDLTQKTELASLLEAELQNYARKQKPPWDNSQEGKLSSQLT